MRPTAIAFLAAFLAAGARTSYATELMALEFADLPRILRENNRDAAGNRRLVEAAQERVGHLRRSYLPTLRAEAASESFQTGAYSARTQPYGGVEARLNLYRGGKDELEDDIRQARRKGAEASAGRALAAELLEARRTYWELVALKESAKHAASAIDRNDENLKAAEKRISAGLAAETDRLEFVIHRGQLKEDMESIQHEIQLVEIGLAALLGIPIKTRFSTANTIPHDHGEDILKPDYDPAAHPEVRLLKSDQAVSEGMGRVNRRWWAPTLDLYGGQALYTLRERDHRGQSLRDDRYAGARLSLPIFDYSTQDEARALSKQAEGFSLQAEHKTSLLRARIERTKEEMKHLHELIHNGEERIELAKNYLAAVGDEYRRGVKNSLDMLGASQRYLGFERQYTERRRDYQAARAVLQFFIER